MSTATPEKNPRTGVLNRRNAVLAILVLSVLAFFSATQPWVLASQIEQLPGETIAVTGQSLTAVVTAMSVVIIAAAITLSIVRTFGRYVISGLVITFSVLMVWSVITVVQNLDQLVHREVAKLTGMTDTPGHVALTFWPWVGLMASVLIIVVGVLVLISAKHWPVGQSRKYDAAPTSSDSNHETTSPQDTTSKVDEIDAWDELSSGEDPT